MSDPQKLISRANKLSSGGFLGFSFSTGDRYSEAAELYSQAANKLKLQKKWDHAARVYELAADAHLLANSEEFQAADQYKNMVVVMLKSEHVDVTDAVDVLYKVKNLYLNLGKGRLAAKTCERIADLSDPDQKCDLYKTAAELYDIEDQFIARDKCLNQEAHYLTLSSKVPDENYSKAIKIYEKIAEGCLDSNLLKWGVKAYYFKAVLCYLALEDVVGAGQALNRYAEQCASFDRTTEYRLCEQLVIAVNTDDSTLFTDAVIKYDSIHKLDDWYVKILLKIKPSSDKELC